MSDTNGTTTEQSTADKIEALEAKRAQRKAAKASARAPQYAADLEQVDRLEEEHGEDRVVVLKMPSFVEGLPTLVVVKTPSPGHFTRFRQMVRKAGQNTEAIGAAKDMLSTTCVLYPNEEIYARMRESWPSIHDSVGLEAIKLGESQGKD